jgi:thiol:disulfide interchange protein DsbA
MFKSYRQSFFALTKPSFICALVTFFVLFMSPALAGDEVVRLGSTSQPAAPTPASTSSSSDLRTLAQKGEKFDYLVAGKDFQVYSHRHSITPGKLEVIYFFWYGSDWSAKIDTPIRAWAAAHSDVIRFQPSPVVFNNKWALGARIFFALRLMGIEAQIGPQLQQAVVSGSVSLDKPKQVLEFLVANGVDAVKFQRAINDPRVVAQTASTIPVAGQYGVQTLPTFVIDGRYVFQSAAGVSPESLLKMVEFFTEHYIADASRRRLAPAP